MRATGSATGSERQRPHLRSRDAALFLLGWFACGVAAPPARGAGGTLDVSWDPHPDPTLATFRVYCGLAGQTGSLALCAEVPATQTTALVPCGQPLQLYCADVRAVRADGCESRGAPLTCGTCSNPGPVCDQAVPDTTVLQGSTVGITIRGANFEADPTVRFLHPPLETPFIQVVQIDRQTISELHLLASVSPVTPVGPVSVEVENSDPTQPVAVCTSSFEVSMNPGRANINGQDLVEGIDFALLQIAFGSFEGLCAPDSPAGAARGTRCDSTDDCGGSPGGTEYCTDRACTPDAPAARGAACRREEDCGGSTGITGFCDPTPYNPAADLDADGVVDGADLSLLAAEWGKAILP